MRKPSSSTRQRKLYVQRGSPLTEQTSLRTWWPLLRLRSGGRLDLKQLWENRKFSVALEALMRNWAHPVADTIVASAAGRNVTQWAKKSECWKAVMSTQLSLPDPMSPELHATIFERRGWGIKPEEVRLAIDPDEIDAIATCRGTEVADWIRILDRGQRTGALDAMQRQVASTLAALAASAWPKEPSAKHAKGGTPHHQSRARHWPALSDSNVSQGSPFLELGSPIRAEESHRGRRVQRK